MQTVNTATATLHASIEAYFKHLLSPTAAAETLAGLNLTDTMNVGQLVLFRNKQHSAAMNYVHAEQELTNTGKPFGVIINGNECSQYIFLYFTHLAFNKKGVLEYKIDVKFANELGLNWDSSRRMERLGKVSAAFDTLTDSIGNGEFDSTPSGGHFYDAYGEYINPINENVKGGYHGQYKTVGFEAEAALIEVYFNANNLRRESFNFRGEFGPDCTHDEVQNDNEEYEAVQRELHG